MAQRPQTRAEQAREILREAVQKITAEMPGNRALPLDLERVYTFTGQDGEPRAIIQVRDVLYLADELLRIAKIT